MNHTHLEACSSTQIFLKENLSELRCKNEHILISTGSQSAGLGRSDHSWTHFPNALAFSCTFKMNEFSLAPSLFLGLSLISYFKKNFAQELGLKWPNDLYNQAGEKCGGLLCHGVGDTLILGLGLNWGEVPPNEFHAGPVFPKAKLSPSEKKELPKEIYSFLSEELRSKKYQREDWEKSCFHLNQKVLLKNGPEEYEGIFKGINEEGAALIDERAFYSGSLFLRS